MNLACRLETNLLECLRRAILCACALMPVLAFGCAPSIDRGLLEKAKWRVANSYIDAFRRTDSADYGYAALASIDVYRSLCTDRKVLGPKPYIYRGGPGYRKSPQEDGVLFICWIERETDVVSYVIREWWPDRGMVEIERRFEGVSLRRIESERKHYVHRVALAIGPRATFEARVNPADNPREDDILLAYPLAEGKTPIRATIALRDAAGNESNQFPLDRWRPNYVNISYAGIYLLDYPADRPLPGSAEELKNLARDLATWKDPEYGDELPEVPVNPG